MTDLTAATEELYAGPPEDFMAQRMAQVKAAKEAGDKELAKQIGGLRKPTRSAWLVNHLARSAVDDLGRLLDLGAALREAQESLDAAELRTLSRERNKAVDGLSRRAVALGADAGYSATETVRQEVAQTLQAALADPDTADLVRRGVLHQPVNYGGFGTFDLAAVPKPKGKPQSQSAQDDEQDDEQDDRGQDDVARAACEQAWQEAKDTLAAAQADAERASTDADTLDAQAAELREQLEEVERAAVEARRTADEARQRVDELAAAERDARPS